MEYAIQTQDMDRLIEVIERRPALVKRYPWVRDTLREFDPRSGDVEVRDEMVDLLLRKGAELTEDVIDFAPSVKVAKLVLAKYPNALKNQDPLGSAVSFGNKQLVKFLLDKGANVNGHGDDLPLMAAIPEQPDMLRMLIKRGANINVGGFPTALSSAVGQTESTECAKILLDAGADVNLRNIFGETPLMYAARFMKLDNVDLLIKRGANIEARDLDGRTALSHVEHGNITYDIRRKVIQALLKNGANIESRSKTGMTPLMYACKKFDSAWDTTDDTVKKYSAACAFINMNASVDAQDDDGNTPLMRAVASRNIPAISCLLDAGANQNLKNKNGQTAQDIAQTIYDNKIRELLGLNANDNNSNSNGKNNNRNNRNSRNTNSSTSRNAPVGKSVANAATQTQTMTESVKFKGTFYPLQQGKCGGRFIIVDGQKKYVR
jgi:ankyrin repeat protein